MRAGELRHRITIEQSTESLSTSGAPTYTWNILIPNLPAAIIPAGAQEIWRSSQVVPLATHGIVVRYHKQLAQKSSSKLKVVFEDRRAGTTREFGIDGIINVDERGIEQHIMCTEKVDA